MPVDPEVYITIAVSCGVGDIIASWPVGLDDRILAPYDRKIKNFKIAVILGKIYFGRYNMIVPLNSMLPL